MGEGIFFRCRISRSIDIMKYQTYLWAILTILMMLVALFFGVRPKGWSNSNDVQWLGDERAIRFQGSGLAYVQDLQAVRLVSPSAPWTIEMAVTPEINQRRGFSALLVMHDGVDQRQLGIWQLGPSLIAMSGDDYDYRRRWPRIVAKNILARNLTRFITITADAKGTRLFVDGSLVANIINWHMSIPVVGNPLMLVLGNSVHSKHGWRGDLHGLSISGKALSAATVKRHFDRWDADRNFDFLKQESPMLLFSFKNQSAAGFTDVKDNSQPLQIPEHMIVLKKTFLATPWGHTIWTQATIGDMVLNIIGFIPLGAVLYGFLQCFSGWANWQKQLSAVILCMTLSLGIELGQAWIPSRVSSLMDLILNTAGAWVGVGVWSALWDEACGYTGAER